MKNKLFYLIGVASLLSYTGTFTSCVNGVDDEYLEQKFTDNGGTNDKGEELPDLNGDYSIEGDYELVMTCNGEPLDGKKVVMAVDETNESATITFSAAETDLESVIGLIPGANLIQGMGLKYTGNSPVPGEKEITITNVPLFKNGTSYMFKGEINPPTYSMTYLGKIEDEKMTVDINYELTNKEIEGTWKLKPNIYTGASKTMTPLWYDWDTNLKIKFGILNMPELGLKNLNLDTYTPNALYELLVLLSPAALNIIDLEQTIADLLQSITALPNGSLYATYAWDSNTSNPDRWSSNMGRNIIRYYYGKEEDRLYVEIDGQFIINTIKSLIPPSRATRGVEDDLKALGTKLVGILKPALENGIPCTYHLEGNKMSINIDGEFLLNALKTISEVVNNEAAKPYIMQFLESNKTIAPFAPNIAILLERLPDLLTYKDESMGGTLSGECKYVKIGLHLEK
ncbi:MAG TPA: DUF4925 domain-containing protein [Candidatus Bacteroides intestinigallinarum]|nr:DUF4925 domain-containing protein [Candidatus Bacteroides intestinigallinarum]